MELFCLATNKKKWGCQNVFKICWNGKQNISYSTSEVKFIVIYSVTLKFKTKYIRWKISKMCLHGTMELCESKEAQFQII